MDGITILSHSYYRYSAETNRLTIDITIAMYPRLLASTKLTGASEAGPKVADMKPHDITSDNN